jgi:hypothetical protein
LEYSAATNLIDETFDPPPLLLLFLLPLPLLHAASASTATPMPANNAVLLDAIVPPDRIRLPNESAPSTPCEAMV